MKEPSTRILVADDERNIRKNLAMVLESAGYQVNEARDGEGSSFVPANPSRYCLRGSAHAQDRGVGCAGSLSNPEP